MKISVGEPFPLGAQAGKKGTNFAIFSANATAIELCIFDDKGEQRYPMQRSGDIWHLFVYGVGSGAPYMALEFQAMLMSKKAHYLTRINCCLIRMLNE
nr:hypothetical protein [Actinobacillus ureae]